MAQKGDEEAFDDSGVVKQKKVSMQDIANRLNITKMSVSKALSDNGGVSEKLRSEVVSTATELGYDFTKARQTVFVKKYNFAFFVQKKYFDVGEDFYNKIYCHLSDRCVLSGSTLTVFVIYPDYEENLKLPDSFNPDRYDGFFIGGQISKEYFCLLKTFSKPIIAIDFYFDEMLCDCVLSDNFYMGYSATNYLIKNGHTNIMFLCPQPKSSSVQDRFYGYRKALEEHNIPYKKENLFSNFDNVMALHTENITLPQIMPTAIVCHCDMAAYYIITTLGANGYKSPENVSLISFDDTAIAQKVEPKLTTFNIDKAAFAINSLEQMYNRLASPTRAFRRTYVPVNLVVRDSVKTI